MTMRKIKNAVNNTTGELIYFKGHAQATYMSDGRTVEDAVNSIGSFGESQKTTEADIANMGFTKNQGTITEVKINGESKGTSGSAARLTATSLLSLKYLTMLPLRL